MLLRIHSSKVSEAEKSTRPVGLDRWLAFLEKLHSCQVKVIKSTGLNRKSCSVLTPSKCCITSIFHGNYVLCYAQANLLCSILAWLT